MARGRARLGGALPHGSRPARRGGAPVLRHVRRGTRGPRARRGGARARRGAHGVAAHRAGRGGVLEPVALREVASLLRAAQRTRDLLEARATASPRLWAVAEALEGDERLADRIERAIEPSGAISDRASPELGALRDRVRGLHRALKVQVEAL